jgi:hypothetical protein
MDVDAYAAREADRWKAGLAEWGQDAARVQRLRDAAEFVLYTPGSRAARPLSILRTFAAPPEAIARDPELLAERASAAATSVLTLAGVDAEPLRSREHILVSSLLGHAWQQQRALDLGALIGQVQTPPFARVGVLDMDGFFPAGDRFKLASDLNRLLAAPDFAVWLEGDPLDIATLLYTSTGKPRVAVLSIAHLDDRERMFFVSLLLNELVAWMRLQRGTSTLRAMVYFDEIMGYLPPVAVPASKPPLLTLLKQARAFGLGMTLATQNPVDLDYKALSNAGTWMLGRLQTERDKARLLDGLEGANAAAGHGFDRDTTDRVLSALQKRTFLLHNVHEAEPVLFKTRWTLSYLRGPLGREEISLLAERNPPPVGSRAPSTGVAAVPPAPASGTAAAKAPAEPVAVGTPIPDHAARETPAAAAMTPPVLTVPQYFAPGTGERWHPMLLGAARISYSDARLGVEDIRDVLVLTPIVDGAVPVDWEHAEPASFGTGDLAKDAAGSRPFAPLPPAAGAPRKHATWARDFAQWVARSQAIELPRSPRLKLVAGIGESERDFRVRVQTALRERRDAELAKVRERYASKLAAAEERVRRAATSVQREQEQATESKVQTGVSVAATIFGALLGRKAVSASTLGRATTAARGYGRVGREAKDVARAQSELAALEAKRDEIAAALERDLQAIADDWERRDEPLDRVLVKPKRGGVSVQLVALVWVPR